jgi:hypothetical protein
MRGTYFLPLLPDGLVRVAFKSRPSGRNDAEVAKAFAETASRPVGTRSLVGKGRPVFTGSIMYVLRANRLEVSPILKHAPAHELRIWWARKEPCSLESFQEYSNPAARA